MIDNLVIFSFIYCCMFKIFFIRNFFLQDPDVAKGKSALMHFPPEFESIPCKPLFFDLAINHLEMPALESKLGGQEEGQKAGLGGWLFGWGNK